MKKAILSSVIISAVMLSACGKAGAPQKISFFAMDTYMTVSVYDGNGKNLTEAAEKVSEKVKEFDSLWSVTNENSEISAINKSGGETAEISPETAEILQKTLEISEFTNGALDCTIYPVLAEWGFTTGEYRIPESEEISRLLSKTGYEKISLNGNTVTVPDGMEIDLGAVGKGQASEISSEILRKNGVTSALLDFGGNIRTIGVKPDGSLWKLGLRSPFAEDSFGILETGDCAVVTSGGYERYFTGEDGKAYCHIIDPKTGFPAESGLASATIVGNDGALCDGLSTAIYVLGAEKGSELWKQRGDFEMILVTDSKEVIITDGLAESFSLTRGYSDMPVTVMTR